MAPILAIFGPNRSQRRNLFFEKFSNERRRHRGFVVVIVAVVVAVVAVIEGRFWVASITGPSLLDLLVECNPGKWRATARVIVLPALLGLKYPNRAQPHLLLIM